MAEFRLYDENSDSDSDNEEMMIAQLAEDILDGEFSGDQQGDRAREAQRMMVLEMILNRREAELGDAGMAAEEMAVLIEMIEERATAAAGFMRARPTPTPQAAAAAPAPGQAVAGAAASGSAGGGGGGDRRADEMEARRQMVMMRHMYRRRPPNEPGRWTRLAEIARSRRLRRAVLCGGQPSEQNQNQNLTDHSCRFCLVKKGRLDTAPHLKFHPTTLRQQILLNLGYSTFGKKGVKSADNLPLPESLISEVKRVHEELQLWRNDNKRFDEATWDSTVSRCFMNELHWLPGKTIIDRRKTARMILQCDVGLYRPNEFLLAASNCLEDEVERLWPLLDVRTREHWLSVDNPHAMNPVVVYWISKCANRHHRMGWALEKMTSYCINKGPQGFDTLTYFWPLIVENNSGEHGQQKMKFLFDHAFHEAIEFKNREAAFFIWRQAPVENYRSMVSAAHCCGARNAYYAYQKAVESGLYDVVQFIWNRTDAEQHNGMLLAEHGRAFWTAAERGHVEMARLMWRDTTFNQRFVLLFEQSCAAFRRSCANGHVEIVRLLWEDASVEQHRQILTMCQWESLGLASRNGHLNVLRYIWENMGEELKSYFVETQMNDAMLSKCIFESASGGCIDETSDHKNIDPLPILRFLFSTSTAEHASSTNYTPSISQLLSALVFSDCTALTALVEWSEKAGKDKELENLLSLFSEEERGRLFERMMSIEQSRCIGITPCIDDDDAAAVLSTACIPKHTIESDEKMG